MALILSKTALAQFIAKQQSKWVLCCCVSEDDAGDNIFGAIPWLEAEEDAHQTLMEGFVFALCDTEEECMKLYDQVIGKYGPTDTNPYNGTGRVYAYVIASTGEIITENC